MSRPFHRADRFPALMPGPEELIDRDPIQVTRAVPTERSVAQ